MFYFLKRKNEDGTHSFVCDVENNPITFLTKIEAVEAANKYPETEIRSVNKEIIDLLILAFFKKDYKNYEKLLNNMLNQEETL